MNRSFMHLHLGFDATGLDDLELHHIVVNSWEGGVDTEQVGHLRRSIPKKIASEIVSRDLLQGSCFKCPPEKCVCRMWCSSA